MSNSFQPVLRAMVNSVYDLQMLRIQTGGRLAAIFFDKLGIQPGEKKDKAKEDQENAKVLKLVEGEINRLIDSIAEHNVSIKERSRLKTAMNIKSSSIDKILGKESALITQKVEWDLTISYLKHLENEKQMFKDIDKYLDNFPIWTRYLKDVKGIGPAMAGMIISYFDIEIATNVSKFWAYCGLDTVQNPDDEKRYGRKNHSFHLVDREYVNKDGDTDIKKGLSYNKKLKTKIRGVLPGVFIQSNPYYRQIYHDYKNRLLNQQWRLDAEIPKMKNGKPVTKDGVQVMVPEFPPARLTNMSQRYMIKMFLKNLWVAWRYVEGLPVTPSYEEEKLGIDTSGHIDPNGLIPLPQKEKA